MKAKLNFPFIFRSLGIVLVIEAAFMLFSVALSFYYHEQHEYQIFIAFLITAFTGIFLILFNKPPKNQFYRQKESFLLVTLSWITISVFGTLPYILTGEISSFTDALFESVSGFTTTGSSIMTDIEAHSHGILFWRSTTHWIGGMGIIVLFIAIFPRFKHSRIYLFNAEASVVVEEKTFPSFFSIARRLWLIYIFLTFAETVLLKLEGMTWFDSICHSFATIATGGFSTKNASLAAFSPIIQYTVAIFMVLSATNFNIYLLVLKKQFKKIIKNDEFKFYYSIIFSLILIATITLYFKQHYTLEHAFRSAFFNISSLLTATGFATEDYLHWHTVALFMIYFAMIIGASSGSTGGGVKVIRYVIFFRKIKATIKEILHQNIISVVKYNGQRVEDATVQRVLVFIILYFFIVLMGTLLITITGVDVYTALGSALTAMGGMGPGFGLTGPVGNFSMLPIFAKYVLVALMLLGRLEIFTILVLFSRDYWQD